MDLDFSTEQNDLRDAVRAVLERAYGSIEQRRRTTDADPGFDEKTWSQLAQMGLLGLGVPEELGGSEAGAVEVAIVAEEIGRVIAPEPFVEAVVLAGGLVLGAGTEEQRARLLPGIADGSRLVAFAHAEPATRWTAAATAVHATRDGDGWRLTGTKEPVPNGARADTLLASAAVDGGTRLFVVAGDAEGLTRTGYRTLDGGRAARVTFAGTPAEPLGAGSDDTAPIERALAGARIAYAHEAVGVMANAITTTCEYLRTRKQFGVPLSTFQALKFRAADMYVSLELARSIALWATLVVDAGGDVVAAADRARLQVSRAGRHIGPESVQLHGGIGVTAEYSVGHRLSRLTAIDHLLGDGDWALARIAARVGDTDIVDPLGPPYVRTPSTPG
jgi:alkylation response protein AidB-like acyl-CoA dehydrogenase